ncbi:MAG: assimilatory sulfite reductase (NADPH) flavoprotein subunit [Pseudomonadota bacterium]
MSVSILKKSPPAPDEHLLAELNQLGGRLDQQQLWWASGYLAGMAAASAGQAGAPAPEAAPQPAWTVFYATETGNSRSVAGELIDGISRLGAEARAVDLADFRPAQLKKETHALFVVATHGIGEAPDGTEAFFEFVFGDRAPRLDGLKYSVLALGDSSYEDFCEMGRLLDERLEALGATRLEPRVDCDVDFEAPSEAWTAKVLERVEAEGEAVTGPAGTAATPHLVSVSGTTHSRKHPFPAPVLENQRITGRESSKDVRHVVLSLEGSGLDYAPGDALGVWPTNPPQLVKQFLTLFELDADTEVTVDGEAMTLGHALAHRLELTLLGRSFIDGYARQFGIEPLIALLDAEDRAPFNDYMADRQVIDVLHDHPVALTAQQLADTLKRVTPRLYSIASSLEANPDEVHVTVGVVSYQAFEREHFGATSNYLAEPDETVPVYIAPNPRFRLPEDPEAPVVMIGAGTGVAPYRAFLEQRESSGATGDNWLFFGDRNFSSDFLYQVEWARYRRDDLLTRHDVAFSRDQAEKIYVQDRIREAGSELFDWLERGAHVYVCGDADHMAPDVHEALLEVIEQGLGRGREAAEDYLRALKEHDRYQRDVY